MLWPFQAVVFLSLHRNIIQTIFQNINFGNKLFTRLADCRGRGISLINVRDFSVIFCVVLKNVSWGLDSSFISVLDG